jgi:putative peptidoglycan lipid II flippase
MGPLAVALSVTQINTLVDSLVAWGLTAPAGKATIGWLPGAIEYPLRAGATAALYYAERFYQLPVGLLGVAVATVIFPLLSRHAAQGRRMQLGSDLVRGMQMICFTSLPAAVGLILLARPLAGLLFEHGAFTAADATRTAHTIAAYSLGVCAYCMLPVIARGFYAAGDLRTPLVASLIGMGINVSLDLALVWPLGECGLALATAISATVQSLVMARRFSQLHGPLEWRPLHATYAKTTCATALLGMAVLAVPYVLPAVGVRWHELWHVVGSVLAGACVFLLAARLLRCEELALLWPSATRAATAPRAHVPEVSRSRASVGGD